jgi:hypothetical protein
MSTREDENTAVAQHRLANERPVHWQPDGHAQRADPQPRRRRLARPGRYPRQSGRYDEPGDQCVNAVIFRGWTMTEDIKRGFNFGCGLILAFVAFAALLVVCACGAWQWKSRPIEWGEEQLQGTERHGDWSRFRESGKLDEPRPAPDKEK